MEELSNEVKYAVPLSEMIKRVENEPRPKMLYSGIKEGSVGIIFGPPKSAKTIFCENLGMAIASGEASYLGIPIADMDNRKVLFISFEEYYTNRTERNIKEAAPLIDKYGGDWLEKNFIVANDNLPRYLNDGNDWKTIKGIIKREKPAVVFLDSLTHMYTGGIEDSETAKKVMKRLRGLAENTGTTVIVIHHTSKLYGSPITMDAMAGSRVVAQELDFMIGLNKTLDGTRYIKDIAFRYYDSDAVKTVEIGNDCWLNVIDNDADEIKLLSALDGRLNNANKEKLYQFIVERTDAGEKEIPFSDLENRFVKTNEMSGPTAHTNLNKLVKEKKLIRVPVGKYQLAA